MKSKSYVVKAEIHGVRVDVELDNRKAYGWIKEYLAGFLSDSNSTAKIKFELKICPKKLETVPENAEWFLHYYGLAGLTLDKAFYFRAFGSVLIFEPDSGLVRGTISEELMRERRYFTHVLFTVVLFEALRYHNLYYIHSGALVSPNGEGILIPANASSGKSTLTLAFMRHGYKYVSDDAVFARKSRGKIEVVPFVREFHAAPRIAEVFSELGFLKDEPEYFPGNDKRAFRAEDVYPGRFVKSMGAPQIILFPEIVREAKSRLLPLSSHQALTRMIPNSALVMFSLHAAKSHLEALKEIVCGAKSFLLKSGRDVYEDPVSAVGNIIRELDKSKPREKERKTA